MAAKGLTAALKELGAMVDDLTSIDVVTVTGKLKVEPNGKFNATDIAKNFDGPCVVVAATHIDADYDIINFRTSEPVEGAEDLLQLHERSMRISREGREAILKLFADIIMKP